ncbi:Uncharacterized protein At3g17950 [Linum grandiflorum]
MILCNLQEDGWPLGLRPLNARVGLLRNPPDFNGSISFTATTLLTRSASSTTHSSSALDTESTGSFFHDKSITLGSLIGLTNILELSRRSTRGRGRSGSSREHQYMYINNNNNENSLKPKFWIFSLCSRLSTDAVNSTTNNNNNNNIQSPCLGHFLQVERQAALTSTSSTLYYGPNDFSPIASTDAAARSINNSLFIGGEIAPPRLLEHGTRYESPSILSCLCCGCHELLHLD